MLFANTDFYISSQNSSLYWNGILLIWNKNTNPQHCIKQWQVWSRFPSLSSIMRVTNVLLLINLNNISNRKAFNCLFCSLERSCVILEKEVRNCFSFSASFFLCCFFSSALLISSYQLFLPQNFRETSLAPLFPELHRHLRATGTKPRYYNNIYLKPDCAALFHKQ